MFQQIKQMLVIAIAVLFILLVIVSGSIKAVQERDFKWWCYSKGFNDALGTQYCTKTVAGTDIVMSKEDIEKFKDGVFQLK